jgi:hypothetical protein
MNFLIINPPSLSLSLSLLTRQFSSFIFPHIHDVMPPPPDPKPKLPHQRVLQQ